MKTIYNYAIDSVTNIPVTCIITGGITQTLTGTLLPGHHRFDQSFANYTFPTTVDLSADADYSFQTYTQLGNDGYHLNDTLSIGRHQTVTDYPFTENFNSSTGGWFAGSANSTDTSRGFIYGAIPYLNGPEGNGNSWYLKSDVQECCTDVWVESPVFNLQGLTNPILSMDIKYSLPFYYGYNNVTVQYSTDGGSSWTVLGLSSDPQWYTSSSNYTY